VNVIRRVQVTAVAMDSRAFGAFRSRTSIDDTVRPLSGVLFAVAWLVAVLAYLVIVVILGGHGPIAAPVIPGQ
jgi:energy-coupling factor transporter transmembrane protein EcfT